MLGTVDQSETLENPDDLRRHHRIGATELGQLLLGDYSVTAQPAEGGDQYELHVGEVEGLEGGSLSCLPAVRHLPEQQPRAARWLVLIGYMMLGAGH